MSSSSSAVTGFAGFNSGLPVDDIIAKLIAVEHKPIDIMQQKVSDLQKQQNTYSLVQGKVNDLLSAIKKLAVRNVDGTTIFDNMTTSSSNTSIATATATGMSSPQNITLEVKAVPSKTVATSTAGVGKFDSTTTLSQLGITGGSFTIYANGVPSTITVTDTDTMANVFSTINTAVADSAISADPTIVNGKIQFAYNGAPATAISFGAGGDTSNFLSVTNLLTAIDDGAGTITASKPNSTLDRDQVLSSVAANLATPLTDGTFTINGVSFDTTGKTLNDVIYDINNSGANVTASYNKGTNSFQLTAKNTGGSMISMADGTGNFLTAMNLISGADTTTSQVAGQNATFVLNGVTMYATSTTVDENVTGLTGVTLNLKQAQPGTTIQISVQQDTDGLTTAIKDVIDKYNTAITYIDQQTDAQNNGPLAGETRLKSLRQQIRSLFTSQISALSSSGYDSLQQAGISTGAIGSTSGKASPQLQFDSSKFLAALTADSASVKKLFIGQDLGGALNNTSNDDNLDGSFTKIYHLLSDQTYTDGSGNTSYGALYLGTGDNDKGLFAAYNASSQKRIKDLNDTIQKKEDQLSTREATLRKQFLAMDTLIGQYQSQGSALAGLTQQLSANSK